MPKQTEVLARDISKDDQGQKTELYGTERILTYKSFLYLNANPENLRYELIGEVDDKGQLVPGNPNLGAQHRQALPQRSAEPVVNTGPSEREKELLAEIERLKGLQTPAPVSQTLPVQERKKPGPKAKVLNSVAEVSA